MRNDLYSSLPIILSMTTTNLSILKRVRLARGWSLRHVAELAGVSHELVRRVEGGLYEPPPEKVAAIAEVLGISSRLLDETSDDQRPQAAR